MTRVRLSGIKKVRNRLGVQYHYVRGVPGAFWSSASGIKEGGPQYVAAYTARAQEASQSRAKGTTAEMVDRYLDSADFKAKSARTQADYRKFAAMFAAKFGRLAVQGWEAPRSRGLVIDWRDGMAGSPRQADYAVTVTSIILNWARDRAVIGQHHCDRIGKLYRANRSDVIWLPEHVARFMAVAPAPACRILTAAVETGLRPGDLVRLHRGQIQTTPHGRRLVVPTRKSGGKQTATIPVTRPMGEVIDATPERRGLILVSDRGHELNELRASQYVGTWRKRAGLPPELRLYDTRGTAATRLLAAGGDLGEIGAVMGWSARTAAAMIERYAAMAPAMTDGVLAKLEQERR